MADSHGMMDNPAVDQASNRPQGVAVNHQERQVEDDADGAEEAVPNDARPRHGLAAGPNLEDPTRMVLSAQERVWALDIKQAIEADPELDTLNDFWCAQLALIEHGNIGKALARAHKLQDFRKEYKVVDSFEFGRRAIHNNLSFYPGYYLSYIFDKELDHYVLLEDLAKLPTKSLLRSNTKALSTVILQVYFEAQLRSPDFVAIRGGYSAVVECWGLTMNDGAMSLDLLRSIMHVYVAYPQKLERVHCYHMGLVGNLFVSMVKPFLPADVRSKFEVGLVCEAGRRLDELFLTPNFEAANQRLLGQFEEGLFRRYQNERSFRL